MELTPEEAVCLTCELPDCNELDPNCKIPRAETYYQRLKRNPERYAAYITRTKNNREARNAAARRYKQRKREEKEIHARGMEDT